MEKIKYIEYLAPMSQLIKGTYYKADGNKIEYTNRQRTDTGFQNVVDENTSLTHPNCSIREKFVYNNKTYALCKERERNLDDSWYIRNGDGVSRGFGDLDIHSRLKIGEGTRMLQHTIRDSVHDRTYRTNRNFGVIGDVPYPVDTRVSNKVYGFAFGATLDG
jgi:hypothetical protein